ncbi:terminase gpA endonuclease subunit, partial [Paraburkholderia tropica]
GRNEESWSIDHAVIEGDPESAELWKRVDEYLKRVWRRADGCGFAVS